MLPSPYRISLGLLVRLYIAPRNEEPQDRSNFLQALRPHLGARSPAKASGEVLFLLDELGEAAEAHERGAGLYQLLDALMASVGPEAEPLAKALQAGMCAIDSPDDLLSLLAMLKDTLRSPGPLASAVDGTSLRPSHIEPDSLLGVFLRQLLIECNTLGFEGLAAVVDDLREYVREPDSADGQRRSAAPTLRLDSIPDQIQMHLQQRVFGLECEVVGKRSFGEVEAELERMLWWHPELPRAQFLRFVNSKHHGELAGAVDALHRYFDYAIRRGGPNATAKASTSRNLVQYAVLNLGAMHLHFGHTDMALAAINETVRIAQQNGDHTCVAFALAWLHQLLARSGDLQAEEVLHRCMGRASEQRLRYLEGACALSLAGFEAQGQAQLRHLPLRAAGRAAGPTAAPAAAASAAAPMDLAEGGVGQSRALRVSHALLRTMVEPPAAPAPAAANNAPQVGPQPPGQVAGQMSTLLQSRDAFPLVLEEAWTLIDRRCLVAAGAWEMLGHRELAHLQARKLMHCHGKAAANADVVLGVVKMALARLRGVGGGSEGACVYGSVLRELVALRERFPLPVGNLVSHTMILVLQEWARHRGERRWAYALGLCHRGLSPWGAEYGFEAHVEALMQWTGQLLDAGRVAECVSASEQLAAVCEGRGLPWHYARLLLQLSTAHIRGCPFDPSIALPSVLRCLSFCETYDMDPLHAMATLLLAQVQLRLGSWRRARALIKAALPLLLEHAPLGEQGAAWLTLAKCHLQQLSASSSADHSSAAAELIHVLSLLQRALQAFRLCHDIQGIAEVHYLESRIHHRLSTLPPFPPHDGMGHADHIALRDRAAAAFHMATAYATQARGSSPDPAVLLLRDLDLLRAVAAQTV